MVGMVASYLRPTLPKLDKIDDPCDGVEADNCERDPSQVATLGKEPCGDCVNEAADDHDRDAGSKDGGPDQWQLRTPRN